MEASETPNLKRRRLLLIAAVAAAAIAVAVFALIATGGDDNVADNGPKPVAAATPIARIPLRRTAKAPRKAEGLAEVVRRDERYELRLIGRNLGRTVDDTRYRVFFANASGEKTLGSAGTDARGTLIGEVKIDPADLRKFTTLRVARDAPDSTATVLSGRLPR